MKFGDYCTLPKGIKGFIHPKAKCICMLLWCLHACEFGIACPIMRGGGHAWMACTLADALHKALSVDVTGAKGEGGRMGGCGIQ